MFNFTFLMYVSCFMWMSMFCCPFICLFVYLSFLSFFLTRRNYSSFQEKLKRVVVVGFFRVDFVTNGNDRHSADNE